MDIGDKLKRLRLSAVSCVLLLCAGCYSFVGPENIPTNTPAEIAFIIKNRSQFAQSGSERLAGLDAGEAVDDLGTLSGCWGAYYVSDFLGVLFTGYEGYSFDPATGEGRRFVLQGAEVLFGDEFTYTIVADDRIRLRQQLSDGTKIEVDVLVTLSGSEMKIAYRRQDGNFLDGSPGDSSDERVRLVFRAFDCPEADGK